jgi:hypothetical protein
MITLRNWKRRAYFISRGNGAIVFTISQRPYQNPKLEFVSTG